MFRRRIIVNTLRGQNSLDAGNLTLYVPFRFVKVVKFVLFRSGSPQIFYCISATKIHVLNYVDALNRCIGTPVVRRMIHARRVVRLGLKSPTLLAGAIITHPLGG